MQCTGVAVIAVLKIKFIGRNPVIAVAIATYEQTTS